MKKLITILLLAFMMAGCTDKKQQYISDLNKYVCAVERLSTINTLIIVDSKSTKEQPSFFNEDYRLQSINLNKEIDSLYMILLDCPTDFKTSLHDIKTIYQSLKKSETKVNAVFYNDYRWRDDMWFENNDSLTVYGNRIENCIYNLQTDIPQAFLKDSTDFKE